MNTNSAERRHWMRIDRREQHRIQSVRVRPGHAAAIVDVSPGGALVETDRGLPPGGIVELQMESDARRSFVRGRVLRCAVSQVHASCVKYRSAIAFDHHLPWFVHPHGYTVPGVDLRAGRDERADPTRPVM